VAQDFPPLTIGRFYVYGGHVSAAPPIGAWPVRVEAGMAFGSGEHATTSGCLRAMTRLARRRRFSRVLDMGCGSGILAIGAARAWRRAHILAVDIDPVSARIAADNVRINRALHVRARASDGYAPAFIRHGGNYDLILSNILARPLVKFAPQLARHLAPGGIAVLSGLLTSQERMVLAAHRAQGLRLRQRLVQQGWSTLVLVK
jgi:ribosomal protein L11 methyltransferase